MAACWGWDSPVPWVAENGQHEKPRGLMGGVGGEGGSCGADREGGGCGDWQQPGEKGGREEGPPRSSGEKTRREAPAARGENLKRNNKTKDEMERKNEAEERAGEGKKTVGQRPPRAAPSHAALRGGGTAGLGPLSNGGGDAGPPLTTPTPPQEGPREQTIAAVSPTAAAGQGSGAAPLASP